MTHPPDHPLSDGRPPSWAWGWGKDRFGIFTQIRVGEVVQTLRWIPPGGFIMGSPEDEDGRWDDEGPRHPVELTQGFWLADTPCTQAFWEEVMGENPSSFLAPRHPVERVSWEDCQRLCDRLRERLPGFSAILPTEGQWEYACRASTETATWEGNLEILGVNNALLLEEIAWYGGNSGSGTHEVGLKRPNPWGLFDILGNVWEWCEDSGDPSGYPGGDRVDPLSSKGSHRLLRGGSWFSGARGVRAAYRDWESPGARESGFGFRLCASPGRRVPC